MSERVFIRCQLENFIKKLKKQVEKFPRLIRWEFLQGFDR